MNIIDPGEVKGGDTTPCLTVGLSTKYYTPRGIEKGVGCIVSEPVIKVAGNVFANNAQEGRVYDTNGISPAMRAHGGNKAPKIVDRHLVVHSTQSRSPDRPSLKNRTSSGGSGHLARQDGLTYCVDTGNSQAVEYDAVLRKLTPRECARLQGFPDWFTFPVSDSQAYKQMGNAVTVNVVREIGRKMVAYSKGMAQ